MRPKLRQKASTTHLKMLHQRKDVSSSIGDKQEEEASLDPNTYSTYMCESCGEGKEGRGGREGGEGRGNWGTLCDLPTVKVTCYSCQMQTGKLTEVAP